MTTRAIRHMTLLLGGALCAACGGDIAHSGLASENLSDELRVPGSIKVITQNMYVGADLNPILAAPPDQVPFAVAQAFAHLLGTNFPERAQAMANEIADRSPSIVALQEVSLIRIQSPGDSVFGGTTPATTVFQDFLATLLADLSALGTPYRVAASVQNFDIEAPKINPDFTFDDVRLTDFNVILARADVATANPAAGNFAINLPLPSGLVVLRGWVATDATVHGQTYRIASAHLEQDFFPPVQQAQAFEFIQIFAGETRPLIALGDFNSIAPSGTVYQMLVGAGYLDAWTTRGTAPGFTCCQLPDLNNPTSVLDQRIDFVFSRDRAGPVSAHTLGDKPDDRTPSGLWPSDHAGVSSLQQTQ